jgi:hypothetical protein
MADIQKTGINEDGVNNLIEAHVVYAADDKFAEILGVSLVSLYENSKSIENRLFINTCG